MITFQEKPVTSVGFSAQYAQPDQGPVQAHVGGCANWGEAPGMDDDAVAGGVCFYQFLWNGFFKDVSVEIVLTAVCALVGYLIAQRTIRKPTDGR